jgi:hypothetical protein
VQHPFLPGVTGDRPAVECRLRRLEPGGERRDQQVDLRREVAVEGAERDIGRLGDRTHLDRLEAALARKGDRGVEDPAATVALRG